MAKFLRFPRPRPGAQSNADLVRAIQAGDERAWAAFLERHSDLIYRKAAEYARFAGGRASQEDLEDEVSDLYLFMAGYLRRTLNAFRGECEPATWVRNIVGDRSHILKAYLLQKRPASADVRLPRILQSRPEIDREIYKRLVWGLAPVRIAEDLAGETGDACLALEARCEEVEALLARKSPRVYERIRANRIARIPQVSIDELVEDDDGESRPKIELPDPDPDPAQGLETRELTGRLQAAIEAAAESLPPAERRVLILLYNDRLSVSDIVELAGSDPNLGLSEITRGHQVYYLKDRALGAILDGIRDGLRNASDTGRPDLPDRALLQALDALLQALGFPARRAQEPP